MKLVDRYIMKTVGGSLALVLFILTGLQIFISFVNQLGDLGKGDFGIVQAILFVGLDAPYQVYLFFPMASLLGCLIGLGVMGGHHELVILRASGMSIGQITLAVFKMSIVVILCMTILGEMLLPKMVFKAHSSKVQAMQGGNLLQTSKGVWLHIGPDILMIGKIVSPNELQQIEQFHFDKNRRLVFVRRIQSLNQKEGQWRASSWEQTNLFENRTTIEQKNDAPWDVTLDPRILNVTQHEPNEMTFLELHQFLAIQKLTQQNVRNFELGYWQRIVLPFTTLVMMLLAIPFVFGPLRSSGMGVKLMYGSVVGFGFFMLNRFFGSLSQIYQFSTLLAAIGPTVLCAGLGVVLMNKRQ
jgi:lipopolysaccharide export system permease protein